MLFTLMPVGSSDFFTHPSVIRWFLLLCEWNQVISALMLVGPAVFHSHMDGNEW